MQLNDRQAGAEDEFEAFMEELEVAGVGVVEALIARRHRLWAVAVADINEEAVRGGRRPPAWPSEWA